MSHLEPEKPSNCNYEINYQDFYHFTAYHILVASSLKKLNAHTGDIWDSGKIVSNQTIQIKYNGDELSSETIYYWKVRVWDEQGVASDWAKAARWEMGLLNQSDWRAEWINTGRKVAKNVEEFYAGLL